MIQKNEKDRLVYLKRKQDKFLLAFINKGGKVNTVTESHAVFSIKEIIKVIMPMRPIGYEKIRIGPNRDGGYVMLEPGTGGIAYSFGVSPHSPWDLAMAERGFKVFQYDASIDSPPDQHPNMQFNKYFVAGSSKAGPYKTVEQIIHENGHNEENDIIMQMDIEGAEWGVFYTLKTENILKFKQIIVEFHMIGLSINKYTILQKIRQTHTPIHIHYVNNIKACSFLPNQNFIYSDQLIEVTYVRNDNINWGEYDVFFPTELDAPNASTKKKPDIPIGYFDILAKNWLIDK